MCMGHPLFQDARVISWSLCTSMLILAMQAMRWPIPTALELREPAKYRGDIPDTTACERYAVKTSK